MASSFFRKYTKRFFLYLNIAVALFFLLGCLTPFINPVSWWVIGFLGLLMPYLIIILILFVFFWLFTKPLFSILPLLCLVIGYTQIKAVFAFNASYLFSENKKTFNIRIVDWNIRGFEGLSGKAKKKLVKADIVNNILDLKPDIICLQEFNHSDKRGIESKHLNLFAKNYPYYYFSKDISKDNGFYESGSVIFSRYPIVDSGKISFAGPNAKSLIFADIVHNNDTIRAFTTHLQSFKFTHRDYANIEKIQREPDETLSSSRGVLRKMKSAFIKRGKQAELVRNELNKSPYPSFIAGDFNDVANSFTYFHIKQNWQDAFLETNFGIGRTFVSLAPTLRIDFILVDNRFKIHQMDLLDEEFSDHVLLVADISIKK